MNEGNNDDAPKLIIDSDWKSEAQAEKERLEQEAEAKAPGGQGGQGEMPEADFRGLVGMLATQALMYMGGVADPESGKAVFDPVYSRHMIDLLGVLDEKTKGNLSDEEAKELTGVLGELRSRFVEIVRMVQQQQAEGGGPGGMPGGMGGGGMPGGPIGG
jgi:hypothetical protein